MVRDNYRRAQQRAHVHHVVGRGRAVTDLDAGELGETRAMVVELGEHVALLGAAVAQLQAAGAGRGRAVIRRGRGAGLR
ncbi:hypothetical protein [Nonomuraea sp. NPDC049709]|uniref:hypothetical protein n=1 Tax=Nonomuraea sp. NPDC049709 TaxID=3154736 RepID=UPI003425D464